MATTVHRSVCGEHTRQGGRDAWRTGRNGRPVLCCPRPSVRPSSSFVRCEDERDLPSVSTRRPFSNSVRRRVLFEVSELVVHAGRGVVAMIGWDARLTRLALDNGAGPCQDLFHSKLETSRLLRTADRGLTEYRGDASPIPRRSP